MNNKIADTMKNIMVNTAKHYVNVACPFITYQPEIKDDVKKLRKF